jgi:TetR/AcrR family transcriptional regulator
MVRAPRVGSDRGGGCRSVRRRVDVSTVGAVNEGRQRGRPSADDGTIPSDETVLRAALDAFAERGFGATSVREIARGLGVSHNLIPQRFGSKDQLWYRAVDHAFASLLNELLPVAFEAGADELQRLRSWMVRFVIANTERPALLRVITQESASPGPRFDYLFDHFIEPVRLAGDGLLAGLYAQGLVTTTSAELLYFFMTLGAGGPAAFPAVAARFGSSVSSGDPGAVRRHAEEAIDLLFEGFLRRPGS